MLLLSKLTKRLTILLLLTGILSACGFHLRQGVALPENLQATSLQGVSEFSVLNLAFKRTFNSAGYSLVGASEAQSVLKVNKNTFSRRVLSVNSNGDPNEYELTYHLDVVLLDNKNKEILPEQSISLFRSYRYNPDIRLAKEAEENRLKKNMINDAVRQVMRRISIALKK